MRILGIDTSSRFLCLGLYSPRRIYGYNIEAGLKLSALLELTIHRVLVALNWHPADIDYFACGLGPGSFTGLRIGLAAVKGFSWALQVPIIGIPSLDIIARNARVSRGEIVMPAIDAKRGLVYCSAYQAQSGTLRRIIPYLLLSKGEFLKKIKPHSVLLGDAAGLYKEAILGLGKAVKVLDKDDWYPQSHNLIALALEGIRQKKFNSALKIKPIYLYPKECQIRK